MMFGENISNERNHVNAHSLAFFPTLTIKTIFHEGMIFIHVSIFIRILLCTVRYQYRRYYMIGRLLKQI